MTGYSFCVLTGSNYLAKCLTMYDSLSKYLPDFDLYYYCFDSETFNCLNKLGYKNIIPIKIEDIETKELLSAKKNRSIPEYYFTLTPFIILHTLKKYRVEMCIYLDADLYFFQSPEILLNELGDASVLITEHHPNNFIFQKEGRFNVQFIPVKNDSLGVMVIEDWAVKCAGWCHLIYEEGKWADQGYLNEWPTKFQCVKVLSYFGAMGPWNIPYTRIKIVGNTISISMQDYKEFKLVFFHFQGFKVAYNLSIMYRGPELERSELLEWVYNPYSKHLFALYEKLNNLFPKVNSLGILPKPKSLKSIFHKFRQVRSIKNFFKLIYNRMRY